MQCYYNARTHDDAGSVVFFNKMLNIKSIALGTKCFNP